MDGAHPAFTGAGSPSKWQLSPFTMRNHNSKVSVMDVKEEELWRWIESHHSEQSFNERLIHSRKSGFEIQRSRDRLM